MFTSTLAGSGGVQLRKQGDTTEPTSCQPMKPPPTHPLSLPATAPCPPREGGKRGCSLVPRKCTMNGCCSQYKIEYVTLIVRGPPPQPTIRVKLCAAESAEMKAISLKAEAGTTPTDLQPYSAGMPTSHMSQFETPQNSTRNHPYAKTASGAHYI